MDHTEEIRKCFIEHVATLHTQKLDNGLLVGHLQWAKPGTSNYRVIYMIVGTSLVVRGDLGDAIYSVYDMQPFEFWANCGVQYFKEKCVASEGGRGYVWHEWEESECLERIESTIKEHYEDADEPVDADLLEECRNAACTEQDFMRWVEAGTNGEDLLGQYWQDYSPWDWGQVVPYRLIAHLEGLKMAMAQLEMADDCS